MKKNPSRCTAHTPQSQEVSIPTPTGSMTAMTQPLSCTKGMHMKYVWILWGADAEGKFVAEVFSHKVNAEKVLREHKADDPTSHYWIQEKEVNNDSA